MRPFTRHTLAIAALSLSAGAAQAQDGIYVKAYGGLSSLQADALTFGGATSALSFEGGTTFGGALGYAYAGTPYRAEVEFAYRSDEADSIGIGTGGDFASTALMVNGYYSFATASKLTPYVGLGLGFLTEIDFDVSGAGGAETEYSDRGGLAFQAMLGAEYAVSDRVTLFGEARYFTAGSVDLSSEAGAVLSADYDTFDVIAGLTFKF